LVVVFVIAVVAVAVRLAADGAAASLDDGRLEPPIPVNIGLVLNMTVARP
jgi:hypothetical protein